MKNGERIGYSVWKESEYKEYAKEHAKESVHIQYSPEFAQYSKDYKHTDKNSERFSKKILNSDLNESIQLLFTLIEKNIELFFAIEINAEFKKKFMETATNIKVYLVDNYGPLDDIDLDETLTDICKEVPEANLFIVWLKERMTIAVEKVPFETDSDSQFQIALKFPNVDAANLMLGHLKWEKMIPAGRFGGKNSPCQNPQSPATLQFPCYTQAGQSFMCLADQKMGRKLFNMLKELSTELNASNYRNPEVPFTNIFDDKDGKKIIHVPTPECLFGYERILMVYKFPETIRHGTLYVQVDEKLKNISFKSTSIPHTQKLSVEECRRVMAALITDKIKINFTWLKQDKNLDIYQNQSAFTIIKTICQCPSALTLKNGTKPYIGMFSENLITDNQAFSLSIFKEAALQGLLNEAENEDNIANKNLLELLARHDLVEKEYQKAISKKNHAEHAYGSLQARIKETKDEVSRLSRLYSAESLKAKLLFLKDYSAKAEKEKNRIEIDLKKASGLLSSYEQELVASRSNVTKAKSSYDSALATKIQVGEQLEASHEERARTLSEYAKAQLKLKTSLTSQQTPIPITTIALT